MRGFIGDIEELTKGNDNFRKVLYTAKGMQLVLMSLLPGEEIGEEVHDIDQFIRIEKGEGKVVMGDSEKNVEDDFAFIIPRGMRHNVINTGDVAMKLYSIYASPEHKDGTIHRTKADAVEEHFDGKTTE
jgi:mannose-6-phosphate isomerase-like protein (cupin superfamily)